MDLGLFRDSAWAAFRQYGGTTEGYIRQEFPNPRSAYYAGMVDALDRLLAVRDGVVKYQVSSPLKERLN